MQIRKIWLKCGGFITIDKTEALTAIDVNTGKYTGTKDVEQTIYKVNEEATIEITKQLRLRDIGGIVIIDYIDMNNNENKEKIQKKFLATPKDMVYSCFDLYPKSLDELLAETGLEIADLNQMILEMQLEGLITEISKNCYVRNDLEI